jgi:DNA (cytosine-5)-methyltransferase 1
MTAYYNEFDSYAAQWLRNLIKAGHIAPGDVDERSIEDVRPEDLAGYTQCHFFAGIGVWSLALRRAGWPDDRPVWTGSCPCQPFSSAGAGAGFDDPRHLWPSFAWLIEQCKPPIIFGEQVAAKSVGPWIDLVHHDVETMGYAFGCVPFPSAGVGAPHIRDRAYWVGNTNNERLERDWQFRVKPLEKGRKREERHGSKAGMANGFWASAEFKSGRDGKARAVEPGTSPLADGAAGRVGRVRADWHLPAGKEGQGHRAGRLKGYGNAINAEAARIFIESTMEVLDQ